MHGMNTIDKTSTLYVKSYSSVVYDYFLMRLVVENVVC